MAPPPPPYKGPSAPPLPANLEGQSDPLPSVGTIMPISGGSAFGVRNQERTEALLSRGAKHLCGGES
jgi:hypothetical protein